MNEANKQIKDAVKKTKKKDFCQKSPSLFMPVVIQDERAYVDGHSAINPLVCLTLRYKSFSVDIPSSLDDISLLSKIIKLLHAL